MKTIYIMTTATQECVKAENVIPSHTINGYYAIAAETELEAAAKVLAGKPDRTYILDISVLQPTDPRIILTTDLVSISIQRLFAVWQDLSAEATGHDTEWSYPISLAYIAQALGIHEYSLIGQLCQLERSELELILDTAALTFHAPV